MADSKTPAVDTAAVLAEHERKEARKAEIKAKRDADREKIAGETKADAFKRIAVRRTNNALEALATLENTFDKANYEYTDDQTTMVVSAIERALSKIKARAAGEAKTKTGFAL